jgi:homocitrate synthase NifV
MATANSISAFQAGAACTSATINGIGERAGNAAIEELIMAMNYSLKLNTDYNPLIINDLCKFTSEASGREIPLMKPISGEMAFKHETGIHINSLLKDTRSYQLFNPEEVGMKSNNFVFGIHSGSAALIDFFRKKSIKINGKKVYDILNKVKSQSYLSKRSLSEEEIEEICNNIQL